MYKYVDELDPEEYLALTQAERDNIKEEFIIPPSFKKYDFGKIGVIYKLPVFNPPSFSSGSR